MPRANITIAKAPRVAGARALARRVAMPSPSTAVFVTLALSMCALQIAKSQGQPQMGLPHTTLSAGAYKIDAQVASTLDQRDLGLMYRRNMLQNEGMLFRFKVPHKQCFWMRHTSIPLSAAFVYDNGVIAGLADMAPQTTTVHCSSRPVRFVLEMNQGWFAKHGISAGSVLGGGPMKGY